MSNSLDEIPLDNCPFKHERCPYSINFGSNGKPKWVAPIRKDGYEPFCYVCQLERINRNLSKIYDSLPYEENDDW